MAARKSVLKPAPRRAELERLLSESIRAGVSDDQLQDQRVSFAYGNAPVDSGITRESVQAASQNIRISR